jgi:hypothetical protein
VLDRVRVGDPLADPGRGVPVVEDADRRGRPEAEVRDACRRQRDQLPEAIRDLVLDDQRVQSDTCRSVFDC